MIGHPKPTTYRSEAWRRAVASLHCMVCFRDGPSQAAHINMGKGMGLKTHDCWTASICPGCHRELDQGRSYSKAERREILERAVLMTLAELANRGLVKPT